MSFEFEIGDTVKFTGPGPTSYTTDPYQVEFRSKKVCALILELKDHIGNSPRVAKLLIRDKVYREYLHWLEKVHAK